MNELAGVQLLPVRHHSPRASAVVHGFLDRTRPEVVLIEGPADAQGLIPLLADPQTRPPVAILGYRTDGTPASSLWPFAAYSPELVALRWGVSHDARVEFIDVPTGVALAMHDPEPGAPASDGSEDVEGANPSPSPSEAAAVASGHRSFEELWEATFEAPAHDADSFRSAILAYADLIREGDGDEASASRARDAYMARRIAEVLASGVLPASVAVVAGAAHVAAFARGDVDPAREQDLPAPLPSALTLIPYSFPRLAAQTGYGAGNRAPRYYQRAHDAGCDFRRATLEVLVDFTEHLRLKGFAASLADTIEAYRLAVMLAQIRGKSGPGLDEVREAATATLCRGDRVPLDAFLWPSVIGRAVGHVPARVGKNSLQEEFWREVDERRLPRTDSPETFSLRLNNPTEVGTSIFLHRLRIAGIPYASFAGAQRAQSGAPGAPAEAAGGAAALGRVRENWEAQWTPATDVALVERIVLGDSLEQVATRRHEERLAEARSTGEAADVLLESVLTACPQTVASALLACDRHAASDDDLPSLAGACRALSALVAYGTSRAASTLGDEAVPALLVKTFARALLRIPSAASGDDEAVVPVREALRVLHEVALSQPRVDRAAWVAAARDLVASYAVHASTSGLALALLHLAQEVDDAELALLVGQRLSNRLEPRAAATFLEGFLEASTLVLVKSRPVVAALDGFLTGIPADRFKDVLPLLRRALGGLGPTERRYLLENLVALRGLGGQARAARAVIDEKDKEKLKGMSAELSKAMDDLDDLL